MSRDQLETLIDTLLTRPPEPRTLVALAGPPGAGKSTLVETLRERLDAHRPGTVQIVPMDGFHLDDAVLEKRGLLPRKGAPETYDLAGFTHLVSRLKADTEDDVYIPIFDRTMELSRAAGAAVPRSARIVLIEGNYLLLNRQGWHALYDFFDVTVLIGTDETTLQERLEQRWRSLGLSEDTITAKVEGNDMLNARLVLDHSAKADFDITN